MPKTVPLPDGGTVDFPDSMSWEEVMDTMNRNPPPRVAAGGDPGSPDKKNPAEAGPAGTSPNTMGHFLEVLGEHYNPATMAKNAWNLLGTDTNELTNRIVADQAGTFKRGWDETLQGNVTEGGPRMLAGLIPLVGPGAVRAGERIGSGDISGGLADAAGLVGDVLIPTGVNRAAAAVRPVVGKGMREAAIGMAGMATKPPTALLEEMAGAKSLGVPAVKRRVLGNIIDKDLLDVTPPFVNPLERGMARAQNIAGEAQAARSAAARTGSQGPVPGSGAAAEKSLTESLQQSGIGDAPQQRMAQVQSFANDARSAPRMTRVQTGPRGVPYRSLRDLTKIELEDAIAANNKELSGLYGQADMGSRARALKDLQGARTESFNTATGTHDLATTMRDAIDARNVLSRADTRISNSNPVSLTDFLAMSTLHPVPIAASVGSKGGNMARMAGALGKGGRRVAAPHDVSKILRALLQSGNIPAPVSSH